MIHTQPRPSDPIEGPDRPWPGMPYPQWSFARPGDDDMPVPTPYPTPSPRPGPFRLSLRVGKPPRRKRIALRLGLETVLLTAACVAMTVGGAAITAALLGSAPIDFTEWLIAFVAVCWLAVSRLAPTPKRPAHPWSTALRAAFHPGPGALRRSRRPVTPLTPAA